MTYRHITNLRTPFDMHDQDLLILLSDYRLGDPIQADPIEAENPVDVPTMKANGIVGLYVPVTILENEPFQKFSGWYIGAQDWEGRPAL